MHAVVILIKYVFNLKNTQNHYSNKKFFEKCFV